jgi:hypothetical protein
MPRGARDLIFVPGNIIKSFASRERARWKHADDTATQRPRNGIRNEITSKFFAVKASGPLRNFCESIRLMSGQAHARFLLSSAFSSLLLRCDVLSRYCLVISMSTLRERRRSSLRYREQKRYEKGYFILNSAII